MNIALLRKIQNHILEEPLRLKMEIWNRSHNKDCDIEYFLRAIERQDESKIPPCGTVACIAGWGEILSNSYGRMYKVIFDITNQECTTLFYLDRWPEKFREAYKKTRDGSLNRAKVTCARIDHFIETNGIE